MIKLNSKDPRIRLYVIAAIFFVVGLGTAACIYLTTEPPSDIFQAGEMNQSKMYFHNLEMYGGKANVQMAEFMEWFDGLWHGRNLAYTIAGIAALITLACLFIASHWQLDRVVGGCDKPDEDPP